MVKIEPSIQSLETNTESWVLGELNQSLKSEPADLRHVFTCNNTCDRYIFRT